MLHRRYWELWIESVWPGIDTAELDPRAFWERVAFIKLREWEEKEKG